MGYPTKIQKIKREKSEQWYVNFPSAIAQAMEFERGEVVEWLIEDKQSMILKRTQQVVEPGKKNHNRNLDPGVRSVVQPVYRCIQPVCDMAESQGTGIRGSDMYGATYHYRYAHGKWAAICGLDSCLSFIQSAAY
jgi:hypothetical protein